MNHRILLVVYNRLWLHTKMTKMEVNVRLIIIGVYIKLPRNLAIGIYSTLVHIQFMQLINSVVNP